MSTVIDFHTHILPQIDDGSRSVEQSLQMLHLQAQQGIDTVVATPHFYAFHESPATFLSRRNHAEEKLRKSMEGFSDLPNLLVGAEVHFFEGMSDCESLEEMAISSTNCVLVEMPMQKWSERNFSELIGIHQKRRLIPIIAHIDRYISPFHTHKIPEALAELPVLVQANASFFTGKFSQRLALKLLKEDKIQLLGSDCHNLDSRLPNLGEALRIIERNLGFDAIEKINLLENKLMHK